jgi:hypothetical protein
MLPLSSRVRPVNVMLSYKTKREYLALDDDALQRALFEAGLRSNVCYNCLSAAPYLGPMLIVLAASFLLPSVASIPIAGRLALGVVFVAALWFGPRVLLRGLSPLRAQVIQAAVLRHLARRSSGGPNISLKRTDQSLRD